MSWKGAKTTFLWQQLHHSQGPDQGDGNRILRYNIKNTEQRLVTNIRQDGYVGFMYFAQKHCGADFLNAVMEYRVHFRIMDYSLL